MIKIYENIENYEELGNTFYVLDCDDNPDLMFDYGFSDLDSAIETAEHILGEFDYDCIEICVYSKEFDEVIDYVYTVA